MSVSMIVDLLATAHAARVLASLERIGGKARFTALREASGVGDQQLSRALRFLNGKGFVSGHVLGEGDRAPMEYCLTRLGEGALQVLRGWHQTVHGRSGAAARMADEELEAIVGE